jgi:methylmalonyl-CoA mutase
VAATSAETIEVTLKDVDLAIAPVHLEPSSVCDRRAWAESLTSLGATSGGMGLAPGDDDLVALAADYPGWIIASIDARCVHESGGTEAQEIAYAAAGLAHVIRRFIADGRDAASAIAQSEIVLAVDADIHLSISKLRAARIVLANVGKAFGVSDDLQLRAVTSQRMMTRTDPWTNLVRLSAAGFAGAVGAADAMTVLPATQALGRPDRLARRVARNMHILLQEESHAGLVANAAAGSYLHETLTAELAKAAWSCFQAIETEGGFDALESRFTGDVSKARDQLLETYRSGERALIGVSRFAAPDLREMRFHDGDAPPPSDPRFPPIRLEEAVETGDAA